MDDRDRNEPYRRPTWIPWAMTSFALLLVAFGAFVFGTRWEPGAFPGEHVHTWHYGFPGGLFAFLLFFWLLGGCRRMWWWGGYPYGRSWRYRRFYDDPYDDERRWEEWHRREHQRMNGSRDNPPT
jgi:hypothetical protein